MSQIAMSLVLLCTTGLFLRSLQNAWRIDIGFRTRGLLMMSVDPRLHGYTAERSTQFLEPAARPRGHDSRRNLRRLHRCRAIVRGPPQRRLSARRPARPQTAPIRVDMYMATAGYFQTMGIPRIAGRDLSGEGPEGPEVADRE